MLKDKKILSKMLVCLVSLCMVLSVVSVSFFTVAAAFDSGLMTNGDFEAGGDGNYGGEVSSAHAYEGNYGWGFTVEADTNDKNQVRFKNKCTNLVSGKTYTVNFMARGSNGAQEPHVAFTNATASRYVNDIYLEKDGQWHSYTVDVPVTATELRVYLFGKKGDTISIDNISVFEKVAEVKPTQMGLLTGTDFELGTAYAIGDNDNGTISAEYAHESNYGWGYTNTTSSHGSKRIKFGNTVTLDTSKTYKLTFWGKSDCASGAYARLADSTADTTTFTEMIYINSNNTWEKYEVTFQPTTTQLRFTLGANAAGSVMVDDIYLEEYVELPHENNGKAYEWEYTTETELLTDGGFENGGGNLMVDNDSEISSWIGEAYKKEGTYGFGYNQTGGGYGDISLVPAVELVPYNEYTVSFDYCILGDEDGNEQSHYGHVYTYETTTGNLSNFGEVLTSGYHVLNADGNWHTYTASFMTTSSAIKVRVAGDDQSNDVVVCVDNMSLKRKVSSTGFDGGLVYGSDFDSDSKNIAYKEECKATDEGILNLQDKKTDAFKYTASGYNGQWITVNSIMPAEKMFKISFWAKQTGTNGKIEIYNGEDGDYTGYELKNLSIEADGCWHYHTVFVTTTREQKLSMFVRPAGGSSPEGTIWLDNIRVEHYIPYDGGLLQGSDFEGGEDFKYTSSNVVKGAGHNGTYGYGKYYDSSWSCIELAAKDKLKAGASYRLSYWAKSVGNVSGAIQVYTTETGNIGYNTYTTLLAMPYVSYSSEWDHYIITFTNTSTVDEWIEFRFASGGAGDFYIDELHLEEYVPFDGGLFNETEGTPSANTDFESGKLSDTKFSIYKSDHNGYVYDEEAYGGEGASYYVDGSVSWGKIYVETKFELNAGQKYKLKFNAKTTMDMGAEVQIWQGTTWAPPKADGAVDYTYRKVHGVTTEDWAEYVYTFTAKATGVHTIILSNSNGDNELQPDSATYVDNIYLGVYTAADPKAITKVNNDSQVLKSQYVNDNDVNMLTDVDSSFEDASAWTAGTIASVVTDDSANAHSGSGYLNVTGGTGTQKQVIANFSGLAADQEYVFSVWVKGGWRVTANDPDASENQGTVTFGITDANETDVFFQMTDSALSDWGGGKNGSLSRDYTDSHSLVPPAFDNSWHLKSIRFIPGTSEISFVVRTDGMENTYIDDITLAQYSYTSKTWYGSSSTTYYCTSYTADTYSSSLNIDGNYSGSKYCQPEDNLIPNSWFDLGNTGWEKVPSLGTLVNIEDGKLKFATETGKRDAGKGKKFVKWIEVKPNTEYVLAFDMNVTSTNSSSEVVIVPDCYNTSENNGAIVTLRSSGSQSKAIKFNSGPYTKVGVGIIDYGGAATFDNMRMFEQAKATSYTVGDIKDTGETGRVDLRDLLQFKKDQGNTFTGDNLEKHDTVDDNTFNLDDFKQVRRYLLGISDTVKVSELG